MVPLHTDKLSILLVVSVTEQTGFECSLVRNPAEGLQELFQNLHLMTMYVVLTRKLPL